MFFTFCSGTVVNRRIWKRLKAGKRNGLEVVQILNTYERMNAHVEYLEQQFALVGDKVDNQRSILMKDGPADYLLYTTGRRNVQFGHWWIKVIMTR